MKWHQRLGIVLMFGCIINCILMTTQTPDIFGIIGTILMGGIGVTIVMID